MITVWDPTDVLQPFLIRLSHTVQSFRAHSLTITVDACQRQNSPRRPAGPGSVSSFAPRSPLTKKGIRFRKALYPRQHKTRMTKRARTMMEVIPRVAQRRRAAQPKLRTGQDHATQRTVYSNASLSRNSFLSSRRCLTGYPFPRIRCQEVRSLTVGPRPQLRPLRPLLLSIPSHPNGALRCWPASIVV